MNEIKKETPPLQAPAIPVINPNVTEQYKAGKSVYDIFKNYGQEYDYDQEIKAAERNRKGALIADMATALSNIGTGLAGRRAYVNTPPATAQANQNIDRLRALRAQGNVEYKRNRINAMMQQLQNDRQDRNRYEDIARDEKRYKDNQDYLARQEAIGNEERARKKVWDQTDYDFKVRQAEIAQKNADRLYALELTNSIENRKLRERQLKDQAMKARATDKKSYIIGARGKTYEYPKEMTDAITSNIFDVMREEAAAKGISIDNMALTMGGNETKSSAMKAFVENNLSKYPKAEKALQSLIGGDVQEKQEIPSWITNPPQVPTKWVPRAQKQVIKWTPKK